MGRRLFDVVDGPFGWDDEMGYGAGLAARPPVFVVTHTIPTAVRLGARFRFVRGGVAEAIREAHGVANGLDVVVMGGAETVRQAVDGGLVDELRIHLAPIHLGSGTPLFSPSATRRELVQMGSLASPNATHITYGTRGHRTSEAVREHR